MSATGTEAHVCADIVRPAVWWREQRDAFEGRQTLDPMFLQVSEKPCRSENGATYEPLYDKAALNAAVAAERDCRTCAHYLPHHRAGVLHCVCSTRCVDGGSYCRAGRVQQWRPDQA